MRQPVSNFITTHKNAAAFVVFALLIALFYGNALGNGFVWDDLIYIVPNPYINSFEGFLNALTSCFSVGQQCVLENTSFDRRIVYLGTLTLLWNISSQPWFFHAVMLVLFWISSLLVFFLGRLLTKNFWISFFAALVFVIHPLHSGVVNYISALPEMLMTLGVLGAVIFHIRQRIQKSFWNIAGLFVFFAAAIFSKETALVAPLIFFALDLIVFRMNMRAFFRREEIQRYLAFILLVLGFLILRRPSLGLGYFYGEGWTVAERFVTLITLFAQYVGKVLFPYPLLISYPFERLGTIFSIQFFFSFALVSIFFAALFLTCKNGKRLAAFSLIWFIVFLAPVLLTLGGRGENLFAERYAFKPSVGFSLLAGIIAWQCVRNPSVRIVALCAVLTLAGLSWFIVFQNTFSWKDNVTLYTETLRHKPAIYNVRRLLYAELGDYYRIREEYLRSLAYFCQAAQLMPMPEAKQKIEQSFSLIDEKIIQEHALAATIQEELSLAPYPLISYEKKQCSEQSCVYSFRVRDNFQDILFPSLVVAQGRQDEEILPSNQLFDPEHSMISLELHARYGAESLTFLFPACGGTYYEVKSNVWIR